MRSGHSAPSVGLISISSGAWLMTHTTLRGRAPGAILTTSVSRALDDMALY
jgi:hypothetical protein